MMQADIAKLLYEIARLRNTVQMCSFGIAAILIYFGVFILFKLKAAGL